MLLTLLGLRVALAQDILVNEILYDPSGTDEGMEWVELCNAGSSAIDLEGWSLEAGGTSFADILVLPALRIEPGEYLLLGAGSATPLDGTMQNGGDATDGLRLVDDAARVIDTLLYDSPNTNSLPDDGGGVGTDFAVDVGEGHVLARWPDCTDSDDASLDFADSTSPTPGAENLVDSGDGGGGDGGGGDGGGTVEADCSVRSVVVNELVFDPDSEGGDDGYEWVELFNTGAGAVDLSGWELVSRKSEASSKTTVLPEGTVLPAGAWIVVGEKGVVDADLVVDLDLGNDSSSVDSVELDCGGALVDLVVYGGKNDLGWLNEDGALSTVADNPGGGFSLGRDPDGDDTNDSFADFVALEYPSPGESNAAGEGDCPGMDDVKLNELTPNPAVPKGGEDEDPEWVELYNAGSASVSLAGWALKFGTSPSSTSQVDLTGLGEIAPGAHLVVGEKGAPNVALVVSMDMGAASSNADLVQLRHCGPGTADTLVYGSPNDDAWADDSGDLAVSLGPKPADGETLQRVSDGYDTDASSVDWVISAAPSPGEANPEVEPAICTAGLGGIRINELLPDPAGTDSETGEWVELYNAGTETELLDLWTIETGTSTWGADFEFPGGVALAPGEFLLIGNPVVPGVDYGASGLSLGNASSAPDGVRLVDCTGDVQDTVLYGDPDDAVEDLELTDDRGFQDMAPFPDSDQSIGRFPDGADSDDSAADLLAMAPSPGNPNQDPGGGGGGGDDDDGGGKGCGKSAASDSDKKCATVGALGGLEWALLGLVALRRRRRA